MYKTDKKYKFDKIKKNLTQARINALYHLIFYESIYDLYLEDLLVMETNTK